MVAVAYRGWSFTIVTNSKALTGKMLVFMIGGGRTWRFDFISGFCKLCWFRACLPMEIGLPGERIFTSPLIPCRNSLQSVTFPNSWLFDRDISLILLSSNLALHTFTDAISPVKGSSGVDTPLCILPTVNLPGPTSLLTRKFFSDVITNPSRITAQEPKMFSHVKHKRCHSPSLKGGRLTSLYR